MGSAYFGMGASFSVFQFLLASLNGLLHFNTHHFFIRSVPHATVSTLHSSVALFPHIKIIWCIFVALILSGLFGDFQGNESQLRHITPPLSWKKTHFPLDRPFRFLLKYFIQICCENSSEVKIEQIYHVFCIIFEVCAICNIITEYGDKSYVKECSILVPDDW